MKEWRSRQRAFSLKRGINTLNQDQLIFPNSKNNLLDLRQPNKAMKRICEKMTINLLLYTVFVTHIVAYYSKLEEPLRKYKKDWVIKIQN